MWRNQVDTGKINPFRPVYLEISEDEILKMLDRQPSFGMYKDNYIITGIPVDKEINRYTADAKFQLSIRHRLTKTVLPFNSFLTLTYTQKSFWDLFADSAPFKDTNYNPGLTLSKPFIRKNKLEGMLLFALEHESNGKDSVSSRSCNYFTLTGVYFFNASLSVQAKLWAGWLGMENKDIYSKYRGYGMIAANYRTVNDRFWVSAVINPREKFGNFNTQLELNIKLAPKANQYLFFQWYQGYGESLLDYKLYTSMLRVGVCIKPPLRNIY
jgi:phospholipase A1